MLDYSIKISAVLLSRRGSLYKPSTQLLLELGLTCHDLTNLTLQSMEGSINNSTLAKEGYVATRLAP